MTKFEESIITKKLFKKSHSCLVRKIITLLKQKEKLTASYEKMMSSYDKKLDVVEKERDKYEQLANKNSHE